MRSVPERVLLLRRRILFLGFAQYQGYAAEGDGKVCYVQDAGSEPSDAEIQKINDGEIIEGPVDQIAQAAGDNGRQEDDPERVPLPEQAVPENKQANADRDDQKERVLDRDRPIPAEAQKGAGIFGIGDDNDILQESCRRPAL